jgi:hypothetical protein
VSKWFTPRNVDGLRGLVREITEAAVDELSAAGGGDFFSEVARGVPGPVFCALIGAPPEHGDRVFEMSEVLLKGFHGDPAHAAAIQEMGFEMAAFVGGLMTEKQAAPGDDLLSILVAAVAAGELQPEDAFSLVFEMLSASTDNTAHSATLAVHVLANHPEQWAALVADPALSAQAVEEAMRFDPRIRLGGAYAERDTMLLALEIPAGTTVVPNLVGAHFDPAVYPDPHRFDITRTHARPQLNFGVGRHFCLGAALARMELEVVLEVAAQRWETIEVAGDVVRDVPNGAMTSLPLRCVPARAALV